MKEKLKQWFNLLKNKLPLLYFWLKEKFLNLITWKFTRALSELQILTKVSYFTLVFVPILAAVWPGVRMMVNQYNDAAERFTVVMTQSHQMLQAEAENIAAKLETLKISDKTQINSDNIIQSLEASLNEIHTQLQSFKEDFRPKTIEESVLPWTWVAVFFAALFSVIAHFIYQVFAPEIVKKHTEKEYVSITRTEYLENCSNEMLDWFSEKLNSTNRKSLYDIVTYQPAYLLIPHPNEFIKELSKYSRDEIDYAYSLLNIRINNIEKLRKEDSSHPYETTDLPLVKELKERFDLYIMNDNRKFRLLILENGAKAHYSLESKTVILAIIASSIFYVLTIILIFSVIITQIEFITEAAGWRSVVDLLPPFTR